MKVYNFVDNLKSIVLNTHYNYCFIAMQIEVLINNHNKIRFCRIV